MRLARGFKKASRTDGRTDRRKDEPTDGHNLL